MANRQVFTTAAIIGVGLIGGSLAGALRASGLVRDLVGIGPAPDPAQAQALGLVDRITADLAQGVHDAELIVIASPPGSVNAVMKQLGELSAQRGLRDDVVITDCVSTKIGVVRAAQTFLGAHLANYVPGHPIAGSERRGPSGAQPSLFRGARWIVCPLATTAPEMVARWEACLLALGARVQHLDVDLHDALFAEVSHMPHAVAYAICAALSQGALADEALEAAGAGLRDTTRVAASDASLWTDILMDNRERVADGLERVQARLSAQIAALRGQDRLALQAQLSTASQWRRRLRD